MTKELLNQFEELELFSEKVEQAVEAARLKTEYPVDLRLYFGDGRYGIYFIPTTIMHYEELLREAKEKLIIYKEYWDEIFIDFYENTPAEARFCGVTIWLNYVDGKVVSTLEC